MIASQNPNVQWNGPADNEMMQRMQRWLDDGRTLAWLPIFSCENFPEVPQEILYYANQAPLRHVWLINQIEDFFEIPDGITGWVLPSGDVDTDVVVGLWEDTLHVCKVVDSRTGEPQTLQSGNTWEAEVLAANQNRASKA